MNLWKRRMSGGLLAFIGFMLSPLSWWNDLFVNVPLAVGFGWLVSLLHRPAFASAVIAGYWLTNLLGFVLMHKGVRQAVSSAEARPPYTARDFLKDILVSLLYTGLIVVLVKLKWIQPLPEYFSDG